MLHLRRALAVLALGAAAVVLAPLARAAEGAPEQLEFAAQEHDLGYRAYVAKNYDEAATHFENAFFAAPNPAELRSAMRARREGGQLARAATLSAIGQRLYPADTVLGKLADEIIGAARPRVFEVSVSSPLECNVAVDDKVVTTEKARDYRFFVDPGKHQLVFGWSAGRTKAISIDARAGATRSLTPEPPPPIPDAHTAPLDPPPASSRPLGPAVFLVGAGLTALGAGVTIWSGIDTEKNPGTAAVRADCVGQGAGCPQYQKGLDAQRRTNILLAATGGVALATAVIGIVFTRFSHPERPSTGFSMTPVVGLGGAAVVGSF